MAGSMVDVAFALHGRALPRDHRWVPGVGHNMPQEVPAVFGSEVFPSDVLEQIAAALRSLGAALDALAREFGTPLYVYSRAAMRRARRRSTGCAGSASPSPSGASTTTRSA